MAHQIETAIFSAREGAGWTGLGQAIPAEIAKDPAKIAALLGATYTVEKRECFYKGGDGSFHRAAGRDVLVRSDTGRMLEVVSDNRYHVTNRQPIDILEAFRDELAAERLEISHAAVLKGGAQIAVCATLPAEYDVYVGGNDQVKRYTTLSTGYDKKHGTKCTDGSIRVVCANTLAASIAQGEDGKAGLRTIRASQEILTHDTLKDLLANLPVRIANEKRVFDALRASKMTPADVQKFFADVLEINADDMGKRKANGLKVVSTRAENMIRELTTSYTSSPGAGMASGTAWGALNAVTHYATHVKTCRDMSGGGSEAARVSSNLNGDAARMKANALAILSREYALAA